MFLILSFSKIVSYVSLSCCYFVNNLRSKAQISLSLTAARSLAQSQSVIRPLRRGTVSWTGFFPSRFGVECMHCITTEWPLPGTQAQARAYMSILGAVSPWVRSSSKRHRQPLGRAFLNLTTNHLPKTSVHVHGRKLGKCR